MADWKRFVEVISAYRLNDELNEAISEAEILRIERSFRVRIPKQLKEIYLSNNGQKCETKGIFKAVYGYDVYEKLILLSAGEMCLVRKKFLSNENYKGFFIKTYFPFAADNKESPENCFCLDIDTGEIFLLVLYAPDWTLPLDWQLWKIKQANTLFHFLDFQILLYGSDAKSI